MWRALMLFRHLWLHASTYRPHHHYHNLRSFICGSIFDLSLCTFLSPQEMENGINSQQFLEAM